MEDQLILVDYDDQETGSMGKLEVHQKHLLHRAFSVFIFNGGKVIIQRRADHKYHSGGKWANTCCSHPRAGETLEEAVQRRLKEEAGIECPVKEAGSFIYYAPFDDGLAEYEYDHVFVGEYGGAFSPDPEEAQEITLRFPETYAVRYAETRAGTNADDYNDVDRNDVVPYENTAAEGLSGQEITFTLPAHSVSVVRLNK